MLRGITLTEAEEALNPLRKKKEGLPAVLKGLEIKYNVGMQWVKSEEKFLGGQAYRK